MNIKFNVPYIQGDELTFVQQAMNKGKLSGNGEFSAYCQTFLAEKYGFGKCLMTHSCTGALEMIGILIDIQPGDEIIIPSYTFVSTANAFMLRGAVIKFVDSKSTHPNMDEEQIEQLITPKTKAIVCVHYAGYPCDLSKLRALCDAHKIYLIEDAAQAIHSFHHTPTGKKLPAGSIGDFAAFSFHDSKNIQCGEGGMLVVNNLRFFERADVIWEKGTNRSLFMKGQINRYEWIDIGSSFLMSELHAAFLTAQLKSIEEITQKRQQLWTKYHELLQTNSMLSIPAINEQGNAHIFFVICQSEQQRTNLIQLLTLHNVQTATHYQSLSSAKVHKQPYVCEHASFYQDRLLRLPLHVDLTLNQVESICEVIETTKE